MQCSGLMQVVARHKGFSVADHLMVKEAADTSCSTTKLQDYQ